MAAYRFRIANEACGCGVPVKKDQVLISSTRRRTGTDEILPCAHRPRRPADAAITWRSTGSAIASAPLAAEIRDGVDILSIACRRGSIPAEPPRFASTTPIVPPPDVVFRA
jgi:hypothetical protein